jgi:uncharacterized protein DUF4157
MPGFAARSHVPQGSLKRVPAQLSSADRVSSHCVLPPGSRPAAPLAFVSWDFTLMPMHRTGTPPLQTKLVVSEPGDRYEQEADRMADWIVRNPAPAARLPAPISHAEVRQPLAQRACHCGGTCSTCRRPNPDLVQRKVVDPHSADVPNPTVAPHPVSSASTVHPILGTPGRPLDAATRSFVEPRFGHSFGHVRIHTDARAAASARSIQALAYTSGAHIVFAAGQYAPDTDGGKRLLAHELAHVVQQQQAPLPDRIFRFGDDTHNIIDQVASTLAHMKPEEIEAIHRGNTARDYSQAPPIMNLLLMCNPKTYGGYHDYDHFDNFEWNEKLQTFQSRDPKSAGVSKDPMQHIQEELLAFVRELPKENAFEHVGSAFHAIEDFFAHSNFVELTHGDTSHGATLITGSVPSGDSVSLQKIIASVSNEQTAGAYDAAANAAIAKADPKSHPAMAKDYKSNKYQMEAIVLATMVTQHVAEQVAAMKAMPTSAEREKFVRETIMPELRHHLRPPQENDKWWERLQADTGAATERQIRKTAAQTPVTVNQCVLSPLRSIEVSKDSNMKLFGPAFSIPVDDGHVMVQMGIGMAAGPDFKNPAGDSLPQTPEFVPFGVQIVKRF